METNNIKQVETGVKHAELRKDKNIFLMPLLTFVDENVECKIIYIKF